MLKKSVGILLATVMLMPGTVFAEKKNSTTMTIEEAVKYAKENSLVIKAKDAEIESAEYGCREAYIAQKKLKKSFDKNTEDIPGFSSMDISSLDTGLLMKGYYRDAADFALTVAKRAKEDAELGIEIDVKNNFYTYLNTFKAVKLAEDNLSNTKTKLEAAEKRFEMGSISQLDLKNFELSVLNAENTVKSEKRNAEMKLISLKNSMNYPIDEKLVPVGEFVFEQGELMSAEDTIKLSRTKNTYLNLTESLALSKKKMEMTVGYYTASHMSSKSAVAAYHSEEVKFKSNVDAIDMGIRQMYNGLVTMQEQMDYYKEYLDVLKSNTEATYVKHEMGLVTAADYREAEQGYFKAVNELNAMELSYVTTKLAYDNVYFQN